MQKPIYAAFASPKGGVGKTTLTLLAAGYLHYIKECRVAVVDCNYPTHPIPFMREQEIAAVEQHPLFREKVKQQFQAGNKNAYRVVGAHVDTALQVAQALTPQGDKLDLILFDLPALMATSSTGELLSAMDCVVFPMTGCCIEAQTLGRYIEVLQEQVLTMGKGSIKSIYLLGVMINSWQQQRAAQNRKSLADKTGIAVLNTWIPYTEQCRAHIFEADGDIGISTLLAPSPCCPHLKAKEVAEELHQIIRGLCGGSC